MVAGVVCRADFMTCMEPARLAWLQQSFEMREYESLLAGYFYSDCFFE